MDYFETLNIRTCRIKKKKDFRKVSSLMEIYAKENNPWMVHLQTTWSEILLQTLVYDHFYAFHRSIWY
jgi:hypothetical protein|tara:strand:- start:209 stop:412 length:204 start_codon:yes stop_codon:yes gene_type:complete